MDVFRQIGNAVPPPVACALSKELLKVIATKFHKEQQAAAAAAGILRNTATPVKKEEMYSGFWSRGSEKKNGFTKKAVSARTDSIFIDDDGVWNVID